MGRPFSEHVASAEWRSEAETWIAEQVDRHGHTLTGEVEQSRIRPWSTQLKVPTDVGIVWFKANCPAMQFEPALHTALSRLVSGSVDEPYAVDVERHWMLTADRGATLGDRHEPTIADWRQVLAEAARLQRAVAGHRGEMLATGLPDCSPATVPERFDRLVDTFADLPDQHPAFVPPELEGRLRATRPAIVDAAQTLAESPVPVSWQHGDLHPWNVFDVGAGSLRVFDFGDAQWAHAVEVLSVPYGWITTQTTIEWTDVVGAYRDEWGITADELEVLWTATGRTQPVNRALTWWRCLEQASAAEWLEWGDAPLHHLSRVLDP